MIRRQSNNQWSGGIEAHPAPKEFRVQKSAGKVLASSFWGQDGILLIGYHPKGQTIDAEAIEGHFEGKTLRESHQGGLVLERQCSGSSGTFNPEETGLPVLQFLDHSPYSPDLALSDYHLFPGLKKQLKSRHFSSSAW